ncbi:PREDICTED: uncharacterized protein LOC103339499 [Prunus mume]|uniref:Uncharacterized protein LOC103339499 n=1 Tax=Prunus mume TaxID=102107 RepID=A0ABM1LVU8_PRUMU|nr:PREDICTED: uncharacterized protein LOC103339499 [Prunus mume]
MRLCDFIVHKSCAELPGKIKHPIHTKHPLVLLTMGDYRCFACFLHYKDGLAYNCSLCNFNLDLKCASNWSNILENDCHDHEFTVLAKQMQLCCDACGQGGDGVSYLCSVCQLLVHKECISLPRHIRITLHQHPLKLTIFREAIVNDNDQVCKVCCTTMTSNGLLYYCQCCNYIAHASCATHKDFRDETTLLEEENHDPTHITIKTVDDESKSLILGDAKEMNMEHDAHPHLVTLVDKRKSVICFDKRENILPCEACGKPCEGLVFECSGCNVDIHQSELNCRGREIELEHFSHKNPLMFKDKQINTDSGLVFCDGCANPMLYSSNQYPHGGFTLHKSCAETPSEMQHPLHPMHPLGLLTIGDYTCVVCDQHYKDRLAYNCSQCDFNLDLKCASNWHNSGNYDCHKHKFTVLLKWRMKFTCDACGQDGHGIAYLCSNCQLLVHKRCTLLPRRIKITAHQHPLMLRWSFEASFQLDDQL